MKNSYFKTLLPHLVAIVIFLLVAMVFSKPGLESGVVMQQSDYTAADAMKRQSVLYREQHGAYPVWIVSMFSGMPAYQIIYNGAWTPMTYVDQLFQLWLPKPMNFFFLCCISFYFLSICLRLRPYVGVLGALAFAYCSYNPILAVAGHDTKLLALAYVPAMIGGIILIYDKKYIAGFALTALFTTLHLSQNHQQISYYSLIIIGFMTIAYILRWIREKDTKHLIKALPLALGAALIGVLVNAIMLFPVYDFAKYSKRGGQLVMDGKAATGAADKNKTVGLSRDYAFQWSYGAAESMSLLFPGITGYGYHGAQRDNEVSQFPQLTEKSHVATYLQEKMNLPETQAAEFASSLSHSVYWGDKPFTSGSVYLGASICFLFILGLFLLDNKHKWWLLSASVFGIILAMGKNFPAINNFLFDYMPMYNKFRTPEMALVIPQITFPIMAVLATQKLIDMDFTDGLKKFRASIIAIAAVFALGALLYFSFDYSKENKDRTKAMNAAMATQDASSQQKLQEANAKYEPMADNKLYEDFMMQLSSNPGFTNPQQLSKGLLEALRQDRASFYGKDIVRSFIFIALTIGLIGLFLYKKINPTILTVGLILLTLLDLVPFGANYINAKSFENADKYQSDQFAESAADKTILADKDPNFRVYNVAGGDPFQEAKTSYYHKSIGGYHPAKIGIYDDLITYQLSGQPNPGVINMLNTKYLIQRGQQGNGEVAIQNPGALGNAWFVKGVKFVDGPVAEMKALDGFDPKDTAVIDNSFKNIITGFAPADSSSTIKQTAFDNMAIKYESSSATANVAVFSEIYYKDWKAYIDGKEVPIAKANYVLRSLVIPAGKHTIDFKFEPKVFNTSYTISQIFSWVLTLLLIGAGLFYYMKSKKQTVA